MLTKTKIALAAMLLAGTASAAMAQEGFFLPNMPKQYRAAAPHATLRSAPVALHKGRGNYSGTESEFDIDRSDRASSRSNARASAGVDAEARINASERSNRCSR